MATKTLHGPIPLLDDVTPPASTSPRPVGLGRKATETHAYPA
ncbi:hypothetical protein [Microbispora sp. CA-102843]